MNFGPKYGRNRMNSESLKEQLVSNLIQEMKDREEMDERLHHIYDIIVELNRHSYEYNWLTEEDLSLLRWALGLTNKRSIV